MAIRKWGSEQLVNTTTAGNQNAPKVVGLVNGGFVVVWVDDSLGAANTTVRFQLYSAAGSKLGAEGVFSTETDNQTQPDVEAYFDGGFVITATDQSAGSSNTNIVARRYNSSGVETATYVVRDLVDAESNSAITAIPGGTLVVWRNVQQNDLFIRQFDTSNVASGGTAAVSSNSAGPQQGASITTLNNGVAAVAFVNNMTVAFRLFNGLTATGPEQVISVSGIVDEPQGTSITALRNGGFVVTWTALGGAGDPSQRSVRASLHNADGTIIKADFLANTLTTSNQQTSRVAPTPDGGFVVVFISEAVDASNGDIHAQQFDAFGERVGSEVIVPTNTVGIQELGDVAVLRDGRLVVVWTENLGGDANGQAVRLQIIDPRDGYVQGTIGSDVLYGGDGADEINGLEGSDTIFAQSGSDAVYGGEGGDMLFGFNGDDLLYGGFQNDTLNGGTGSDILYGEEGNDLAFAELGDDLIFGFDGSDTVNGGAGDDAFYGQNDNDVFFGDAGADAFFGGLGGDTGFLGVGNDVGFGEEGGDTLIGDDGDDVLDGGAGGDVLNGGNGVDNLIGGGEGDILIGGPGGDRLEGGAGGDLYWWQAQTELNDLVVGFNSAEDQLQFTGNQFGGFAAGSVLVNGTTFISSANPNPTGAVPTFLYNTADGSLFFDPDGTGGAARIFVALFQGAPALTAGDFQFV